METTTMRKLMCHTCKISYDIDYEEFYKKMVELGVDRKDIICPVCKGVVITLNKIEEVEIPKGINGVDNQQIFEKRLRNIEEKLKEDQYICPHCKSPSGWYRDTRRLSVPIGVVYHHLCDHCGHSVTTTIGGAVDKPKKLKVPEVDLGYSGIEKYPKARKRVFVERVPIMKWD